MIFCNFCLGGPCSLSLGLKISSVVFQLPVIQPGHSGHFSPVATESGSCANLFFLLVLSREWMAMGEWDDYFITSDYGSFPHSLLSTSKFLKVKKNKDLKNTTPGLLCQELQCGFCLGPW